MKRIITFEELKKFYNFRKIYESSEHLITSAMESVKYANVFLSYSSKDKDKLPEILSFLSQYWTEVYIDKYDKELPKITNYKTAKILKERINAIPKFILFVAPNSKDSKWIPWELGLADGIGKYENIAILPASYYQYDSNWTEQEYLGLYQQIIWGKPDNKDIEDWIVFDKFNNQKIYLREWLKWLKLTLKN